VNAGRVVIWDLDGTLGYRDGMWRSALMEILDERQPAHGVDVGIIRTYLQRGFPWHRPEIAHPELSTPEA
jgi:putative hydrolase of the HAD superfamily